MEGGPAHDGMSSAELTEAEKVRLLQRRIEQSGLSARKFAEQVLLRDERTVRRWISGASPIPQIVLDFLDQPWEHPWP